MLTERLIDANNCRLNLAIGPENGPPLLLLHGVSRCWADFAPLFAPLAARWQIVALDFRGHGRSDRAPQQYHVVDYVEDAIAALTAQLSQPAVIFGHSLGALVAAAVAAREPQRVRGVILEDPPSAQLLRTIGGTVFHALFTGMQRLAGSSEPITMLSRQLAATPLPGPSGTTIRLGDTRDAAALRFSVRCLKDVDPEVFTPLTAGRWLEGYDVDSVMAGIQCPALLLRGEEARGGMLGRTEAENWVTSMADGTLIDIPGVGHLLHWLATKTTTRVALSFLESLR